MKSPITVSPLYEDRGVSPHTPARALPLHPTLAGGRVWQLPNQHKRVSTYSQAVKGEQKALAAVGGYFVTLDCLRYSHEPTK